MSDNTTNTQPEIRKDRIQAILRDLTGLLNPLTTAELIEFEKNVSKLIELIQEKKLAYEAVEQFLGYE